MKFISLIIFFLLCTKLSAKGQWFYDSRIHIGQKSDSVQALVVQEVQTHYNAGGWLLKMSTQAVDYKGKLKDIVLNTENLLIPIFNKGVDVTVHFIMDKDTLSHIIMQYPNLSPGEAKQLLLLDRHRNRISDYYFDKDYKAYNHVYIADNGIVTIEYRKTIIDQLPSPIQEQLNMLRKDFY